MTYRLDDEEREYNPAEAIEGALSPDQRREADAGRLEVYDEFGHLVGLVYECQKLVYQHGI